MVSLDRYFNILQVSSQKRNQLNGNLGMTKTLSILKIVSSQKRNQLNGNGLKALTLKTSICPSLFSEEEPKASRGGTA